MALLIGSAPGVVAGLFGARLLHDGDLVEQLVADANSIVGAPRLRPVHVENPGPGSLGQALAKHLPPFEPAAKALWADSESRERLRAVLEGEAPPDQAPAPYLEVLNRLGSELDGVLAASRAERADLASAEDGFDPAPGTTWAGYQLAVSLAGLRARQAIASARPEAAASDCLDGLGLARDAAFAGGLVGRMTSVALTTRLTPTCAAALEALPSAERSRAVVGLRRIRDAIPGVQALLREEKVQMQLYIQGPYLGDGIRARLLERPRLMAKGFGDPQKRWFERLIERAAWRDVVAVYDKMIPAADLPASERDAAFATIDAETGGRMKLFASKVPQAKQFLPFALRAETGILRLDLLVLAAATKSFRDEHGVWPASLAALQRAGFLTDEEYRRMAAASFVAEGGDVVVVMPLPRPTKDAPGEVRVRLGG